MADAVKGGYDALERVILHRCIAVFQKASTKYMRPQYPHAALRLVLYGRLER